MPSCPADALAACEPPILTPENATLGETEAADAGNRARWLRCVIKHNALRQCVQAQQDGYDGL